MKKILWVLLLCMPLTLIGQKSVEYFGNVELTGQFVVANSRGESYALLGILNTEKVTPYCFGISTTHGIAIKKSLFAGFGIGVEMQQLGYFIGRIEYNVYTGAVTKYMRSDRYLIPIFFYGKYSFLPNGVFKPYIDFKIGTGIEQRSLGYYRPDKIPMFLFNPQIGLAVEIKKERSVFYSIGYRYTKQTASLFENNTEDSEGTPTDDDNRMVIHGITMSIGINF